MVSGSTHEALAEISAGHLNLVAGAAGLDGSAGGGGGLDPRTVALARIATLIALDAPPASYASQVAETIEAGAEPEEILAVLLAVAPQVGGPRAIAAAPEIMLALGLSLPESFG